MDLIRVDFALIPDDPLFGSVVSASQAITDEFYYNENVIDNNGFPPHLSLHICTLPQEAIQQVVDDLGALVEQCDLPSINPLGTSHPTRPRALDLCGIGDRSERWDVLASFPIGELPHH
ncbi:MAG: hypothetical protein ACRDSP_20465 [Pseudonocardiaceae bacterium]